MDKNLFNPIFFSYRDFHTGIRINAPKSIKQLEIKYIARTITENIDMD